MQGRGEGQGRGPDGRGQGRGGMDHEGDRSRGNAGAYQGRMGQHGPEIDPARLDDLKTRIGVKPEQEAAWSKYTAAVKEANEFRAGHEKMDKQAVRQLPQAERQAFMTSQRDQAREQFTKVNAAAKDLAAALDDAQKAKARDLPGLNGPGAGQRAGLEGQHNH